MGEMADMLLEQAIEGDWTNWDMFDDEPVRPPKILKCSHCKKPNLVWRHIKDAWVMFEPNGKRLHTCEGYTPNLEVLKELARRQVESSRAKALNGLYNRMMKAGGFKKIVNIVTNEQLLDLFVRVNREHGVEYDDVGWGHKTDYSKQLAQIRAELLKRMNK
jgi:hypothetical protein